jgi:hypothetical protein
MAVPASDDCTSLWSIRCTQPAGTSGGGTITVPSGSPGGETIGPGGWLTRRVNRDVGSNQAKSDVVDAGGGGSQARKAAGSDGEARRGSGVTVMDSNHWAVAMVASGARATSTAGPLTNRVRACGTTGPTIQPTAGASTTVGGGVSGVVMSGNDSAFIYSAPIALAR